jgi:hypothetical protein
MPPGPSAVHAQLMVSPRGRRRRSLTQALMPAAPHRRIRLEQSDGQERRPGVAVSGPEATKKTGSSSSRAPCPSCQSRVGNASHPKPIAAKPSLTSSPPQRRLPWANPYRNDRYAYRFLISAAATMADAASATAHSFRHATEALPDPRMRVVTSHQEKPVSESTVRWMGSSTGFQCRG